jgi:hypothetical protein
MRSTRRRTTSKLDRINWLNVARRAAVVAQWAALALVVAVVAIGIAPRSPVRLDISTAKLAGLGHVVGTTPGVAVDAAGRLAFRFTDPSLPLRMLNLATTVPGLLLVAEIARRMAKLLRKAQDHDPFTAATARQLTVVAKITAVGGLVVWATASITRWVLSSYVLAAGHDASLLHRAPLGWLGAALIIAAFGQIVTRGVAMRTELDTII